MATIGKFFTRFSIFLWCGIGFLFVSIRHIMVNGYSHKVGFMIMLGLAFMAAAITDKKKKQLQAWREEQEKSLKEEIERKKDKGGMKQ